MRDNPIQFAVVREDARIERAVVERATPENVLMVGSGGCTALTLRALYPDLRLTLIDPNESQLALIERKRAALSAPCGVNCWGQFNVGNTDRGGLSQCGNFESLFAGLRHTLEDLVAPAETFARLFETDGDRIEMAREIFESRFWPSTFEMFFCDAFLEAMFGPDATQHAPRGSYPGYFRRLFERGILRADAPHNPFLHHVFLGQYRPIPDALPFFLTAPRPDNGFEYRQGLMQTVDDFHRFDLVNLSNIFDWMKPAEVENLIEKLKTDLRPGARVIYRQLNNDRDLEAVFGSLFVFDDDRNKALQKVDRSLFYSSVHLGTKR